MYIFQSLFSSLARNADVHFAGILTHLHLDGFSIFPSPHPPSLKLPSVKVLSLWNCGLFRTLNPNEDSLALAHSFLRHFPRVQILDVKFSASTPTSRGLFDTSFDIFAETLESLVWEPLHASHLRVIEESERVAQAKAIARCRRLRRLQVSVETLFLMPEVKLSPALKAVKIYQRNTEGLSKRGLKEWVVGVVHMMPGLAALEVFMDLGRFTRQVLEELEMEVGNIGVSVQFRNN